MLYLLSNDKLGENGRKKLLFRTKNSARNFYWAGGAGMVDGEGITVKDS